MKPAQHVPRVEGVRHVRVRVDGVKAVVIGLDERPASDLMDGLEWKLYKARVFGGWSFVRDESE